jgi:hypothetical protein
MPQLQLILLRLLLKRRKMKNDRPLVDPVASAVIAVMFAFLTGMVTGAILGIILWEVT